jgi:hypothetical protein
MWERYRLFAKKQSLGSSSICYESINAVSIHSKDKVVGILLDYKD